MSAVCRLAGHKLPVQLHSLKKPNFLHLARHVTLKPVPKPIHDSDYDTHNLNIQRPMSPITIYAVELQSTLSITHRITGGALAGYTILLGTGALVLPHKLSYYVEALHASHPSAVSIFALKFILALPFAYHFCNGIRHLIWDTARFLTISGVHKTGYIMLAATLITTIALLCT